MNPMISGSLIHYAKKNLCLLGRDSSSSSSATAVIASPADSDQRKILEEIAGLLPIRRGVTPASILLQPLRTAMVLQCGPAFRDDLERRVGAQLEQVALKDLLVPSLEYTMDTLYDVDCVQRILDHFMTMDRDTCESAVRRRDV